MKKQLMTGLFTVLALTAGAQTFQEWRNPEINAVNRAPMHTNYFAFENADAAKKKKKNLRPFFGTGIFFGIYS